MGRALKIVTVVGARPQFIKASIVSQELRKKHQEILVHTGQHYDYNMSKCFFDQLFIPTPDYNLGISGGSHAEMTGRMMIGIEKILINEKPDWLLIYGDTNSTLAAALAAAKIHIPICHVEAGLRVKNMDNPEEINRICTDHVSTLLLASSKSGYDEMVNEGLQDRGVLVGDTMFDAFLKYSNSMNTEKMSIHGLDGNAQSIPKAFYYLTCHREENTDETKLLNILKATEELDAPTVYPVHPRNKKRIARIAEEYHFKNLLLSEPIGYLESICLINNALGIITDSGGVQREAFFARKKCVTVLDFVCWPETMVGGRNVLSKPLAEEIVSKIRQPQVIDEDYMPFGDGTAGKRIVDNLEKFSDIAKNDL